jgi:hypothetical protein
MHPNGGGNVRHHRRAKKRSAFRQLLEKQASTSFCEQKEAKKL